MATKTTNSKQSKKTTASSESMSIAHQQESTLWLFGITLILLGVLLVVNLVHTAATSPEMVKGASTINRPTTVNQELRSIEHILKDIDQDEGQDSLNLQ